MASETRKAEKKRTGISKVVQRADKNNGKIDRHEIHDHEVRWRKGGGAKMDYRALWYCS